MKPAVLFLLILGISSTAVAAETVDYARQIKPVLKERCYACHGVLKQQAELRLDTAAFAVKGGESGAAIVAGDPDRSLLIKRVTSTDSADRMPPEGEPLKPEEIAAIQAWIAQGAMIPADEVPERDPRDHWAFQIPRRPEVPNRALPHASNPLDAFIVAAHQEHGLTAQPSADKRILLRRVTLDLIGLLPTQDEIDDFLADQSPDAFDNVVTRLLTNPHYGERWGRHWMDIWRYSDWWGLGEDARNSHKHIWHWRDWIVQSLNADKGYDQMLREMLAADELYPADADRLRAGGYLARQYFKFNRTSWMDEAIEHTSKAMIGLTFNCAKCHDHKYDPFTQADYYRFRAIFEPYQVRLDAVDGQLDFENDGIPRPFDCNLEVKTFVHIRGDDRNPDKGRVMPPGFPAFLTSNVPAIQPVTLPAEAIQPGLRPIIVDAHLKQAHQRIDEKRTQLEAAQKKLIEAEKREGLAATTPATENRDKVIVRDDFSIARPDIWEMHSGNWSYLEGKLVQSQAGDARAVLRLKQTAPVDFEAKLRFTTTGGNVWKSVGITFDVTDTNEYLAYLSAYAQGSKAQFAYKQANDYVYPAEGAAARPIELNKPYEMTLRVRGDLVNIGINGEHAVAFHLPKGRQRGALELITFDAKTEFHSFELRELPSEVMLIEAKTGQPAVNRPMPLDQAKLEFLAAEKALAWAELQPEAIRARDAADQARFRQPDSPERLELARAAGSRERVAAVIKAEENVARTELELKRAAADKKTELESKLAASKTALDAVRKAIDEPSDTFTSLSGALKTVESNLETEESRQKPFPSTSTGRRTALAHWITDRQHPLTARVAINHIWSRHLGRPLVPTVFDFGRKGMLPSHPELLDWLAVELMNGNRHDGENLGWHMKRIHRLIVTSSTYRLTSSSAGASQENLVNDRENRFYWRMNPIRMESQIVRDSLLGLADILDPTMSGPSIPTSNEGSRRRSMYFVHSNIDHQKFLSMFDDASVLDCYRRTESIVPQQALALENSALASEVSATIARRIGSTNSNLSDGEFVRITFETVLGVEPTEAEQSVAAQALARLTDAARRANRNDPIQQARTNLVQALLNHNDFVTIR